MKGRRKPMLRQARLLAAAGSSLMLLAALTVWSCYRGKPQTQPPAASVEATSAPLVRTPILAAPSCASDGGALNINCPAFPNTTPTAQPQWDYFAWNSFIAANWPAVDPASNNEQRGFPNLAQRSTSAKQKPLLMSETFNENRALSLYPPV